MDLLGAWTTITVSALLVLAGAFPLRERLSRAAGDVVLWAGGAGLAIGGLLLFDDVSVGSWIVAPLAAGTLTVAHVRVLFAGTGPLRT